jgi:hypothetical protein
MVQGDLGTFMLVCLREGRLKVTGLHILTCVSTMQVTAFGAIKSDGVTGVLPTGVQFSFGKISRSAPSSSDASSNGEPMVRAISAQSPSPAITLALK